MFLFMDGQGYYDTSGISEKWTVQDDTDVTWSVAAEGRFANCLKRVSTGLAGIFGASGYVECTPLMTQSGPWTQTVSGCMGFAIKVDDLDNIQNTYQGASDSQALLAIREGSAPILNISLNSSGTFGLYYHSDGAFGIQTTYVGSSIQGLRSGIWSYVEIKWLIHGSAGYVKIRVNGVEVMNYTGRTTGSSVVTHQYTGVWNTVRLGEVPASAVPLTIWIGDVYLIDLAGSGDDKRDFLGDQTIDYIKPVGPGNVADWTPLAGANWENVDEVPPDGDTTYVSTTAPTTRDSYEMSNVPAGTIPTAFQTIITARKETEGSASLTPTYREGGVTYDSNAQGVSTPTEYRQILQPYDTNPATDATITEAEINAAEFGVLKAV